MLHNYFLWIQTVDIVSLLRLYTLNTDKHMTEWTKEQSMNISYIPHMIKGQGGQWKQNIKNGIWFHYPTRKDNPPPASECLHHNAFVDLELLTSPTRLPSGRDSCSEFPLSLVIRHPSDTWFIKPESPTLVLEQQLNTNVSKTLQRSKTKHKWINCTKNDCKSHKKLRGQSKMN